MIHTPLPIDFDRHFPSLETLHKLLVLLVDPDEMHRIQLSPQTSFHTERSRFIFTVAENDRPRVEWLSSTFGKDDRVFKLDLP